MGIDWMTAYGVTRAVPPAYTQWIGGRSWPTWPGPTWRPSRTGWTHPGSN